MNNSFITKISLLFIKNYRLTILLSVIALLLGYASYTTLLKREGFPPVEVPVVLVQTSYFANDIGTVDENVTTPIERAVSSISEVSKVMSTTTANFSVVVVEFEQSFSAKEGARLIADEVKRSASLPDEADTNYQTFSAGAVDGEHDMLFTLSGSNSIEELQEKAGFVAGQVQSLPEVRSASALELITTETNPITGQEFDHQSRFNRVGVRNNGQIEFKPAVAVGVIKRDNVGTIELSQAVRNKINDLKGSDLAGLNVIYGGDFAVQLEDQIGSLEKSALAGLLTIVAVLFLIINWRASLILAVFLPLAMAATFLSLYLIGYSLNTISLFALILVLGLFVDDGIIVVEAIDYYKQKGLRGAEAVRAALNDIGWADIVGTLTTILVFLPMAFVAGILGDFIRLIPITVILALFLSLIIALVVLPFLSVVVLAEKQDSNRRRGPVARSLDALLNGFGRLVTLLGVYISKVVAYILHRRWLSITVILASIVLVVWGGSFAGRMKFSVFPAPSDTKEISVNINYPPGYSIEQAEQAAVRVESILTERAGGLIESVTYITGTASSAYLYVSLTPMSEREPTSTEIANDLNDAFAQVDDVSVRAALISAGPPVSDYPFAMQVFAEDQATLERASENVRRFLDGRTIAENEKVTEARIDNLDSISKLQGRRYAEIKAKITDPENTGLVLELQKQVQEHYTPQRLSELGLTGNSLGFDLGQESENLESFNSTLVALAIALSLMYALLLIKFNSFLLPLLIFLAIPFSIPGIFPGLYATGNALGFFVMIGAIALAGIVVNNTIILVEYANHARLAGSTTREAIIQAVRIRFRPMLATSATTIGGLLPLAFADPFWESLAYTIIFGLTSSLILVLLAFPVYYVYVEQFRGFVHRKVFSRMRF